jgi:hypothetical protein
MAKAGDTIESPLSGARIVFLKTARDTNGELLQLTSRLRASRRARTGSSPTRTAVACST